MYIKNIVNSFIGKVGNIGLRTSYIINELNDRNIKNNSYSRDNMGIFGHIPRILNAIRIYINIWFNHRIYDIWIFEKFFLYFDKDINDEKKVAHIWEHSPKIITHMKKNGYITILDIPIAPTYTSKTLIEKYPNSIELHPHEANAKMEQEAYLLADYLMAPSFFVKDEITKLGIDEKKIFIVPFGAELKNRYKKDYNKDYNSNGIDYCFAGTINKRKGIEFLLEAWNDERFQNDRLHLCGRVFPEIEELLKKYNFSNIITPGFIDIKEYFKKCDVYVFPSLLEGSSKSIYEAMSMSLPCIVTPNSGSVIQNNIDGFIIDIANSEIIREKMLEFKNNNSLIERMGNEAFKNIEKYSWKTYATNVCEIYKKVIN
jgi:glycosyltransferase involved in cell wall biosynthesis